MKYGMTVDLDVDGNRIVATIVDRDADGAVIASKEYDASRVHGSLTAQVALYGLSKLLQDRTSDSSVRELGPQKLDVMEEVLARFEQGEWTAERTRGGPITSEEVEALAQIKGVSVATIQKSLNAFTKEQREGILANPRVKAVADQIRAQRAEAGAIDLSDFS